MDDLRVADDGASAAIDGGSPDAGRLRPRWVVAAAAAVAVLLVAAFIVGTQWGGRTQTAVAYCSVIRQSLSCGDSPGSSEYVGAASTPWSADGSLHSDGRPECLPGFDRVARLTIAFEPVDPDKGGTSRIVWVDCDSVMPG